MNKFEIVNIDNKVVTVDLSKLIKEDIIYFNATEIAKQFNKKPESYLRTKQTNSLIDVISRSEDCSNDNLIIIKQGGINQGTWLHKSLAIDFARWCSAEFAYNLDKWIMQRLNEEKERKQSRSLARLEFPQLTDAIQEFLLTGKDSDKWLYSTEADMINSVVLGCKAKKYCELNNIDRTCLRDNLSQPQINLIHNLQSFDTALIQSGMDYVTRKEKVSIRYAQLVNKLLNK